MHNSFKYYSPSFILDLKLKIIARQIFKFRLKKKKPVKDIIIISCIFLLILSSVGYDFLHLLRKQTSEHTVFTYLNLIRTKLIPLCV